MVEGIRVTTREPAPEGSPDEDAARERDPGRSGPPPEDSVEVRSRLRRALLCPYCHDQVGRQDALVCARPGCGALYHRECWGEVAAHYGGCAVYGCGSTKSRELSVHAYLLRLFRQLVAAALFPPRVLVRFVHFEDKPEREIAGVVRSRGWRLIVEQTLESLREFAGAGGGGLALGLVAAAAFVLFAFAGPGVDPGANAPLPLVLALIGGPVVLAFAIVFALVAASSLALTLARALGLALRAEIAALQRADTPTATVVGRLKSGAGRKTT